MPVFNAVQTQLSLPGSLWVDSTENVPLSGEAIRARAARFCTCPHASPVGASGSAEAGAAVARARKGEKSIAETMVTLRYRLTHFRTAALLFIQRYWTARETGPVA